jgi:predicted Fe-Mo cluster-binding NifX family protein
MRIAVATSDFAKVAGHAGRARKWLIYTIGPDGTPAAPPERLELAAGDVFHYAENGRPHALDGVNAVIAQSAGEGFLKNMEKRGIRPVLTAEDDPAKAVRDLLAESLSPPRPRPIGSLVCKTIDLLSRHK